MTFFVSYLNYIKQVLLMVMGCDICGEEDSLLEANHRKMGKVMVCRKCWSELYRKNKMVTGSGGCSTCSSFCGSCGF